MRVIAPVLGVEDACAQPGQVHPRHIPETFRDSVVGVLHGRGVLCRCLLEDVGTFQDIRAGMAEVVQHWSTAKSRGIHLLEER